MIYSKDALLRYFESTGTKDSSSKPAKQVFYVRLEYVGNDKFAGEFWVLITAGLTSINFRRKTN